jgi:hypothetical protein
MMTGSGECYTGDCDHPEHLTDQEKIAVLKNLLVQAGYNDPSKFVNGQLWHEQVKEVLK